MKYLVLLQPQEIVQNRVNSPNNIADFAKKVNAVVSPVLSQIQNNQGFVVVIVNDKGEIRVWLDLKLLPSDQIEKQLIAQIQQLKPFVVKEGIVGLALAYETGNEVMTKEFPHPVEWQKALENQTENIDFDSFIAKIWNK